MFPTKEFRIQCMIHDLKQTDIAEHLGVHPSAVSQVVNNLRQTPEIKSFLMRILRDMKTGSFAKLDDYDPDQF